MMRMKVFINSLNLFIIFELIFLEEGEEEEPINFYTDQDFNLEDYLKFRAQLND